MTTNQAARELRVSSRRVRALIQSGRIPAKKHGTDWNISPGAIRDFTRLPAGRPKTTQGKHATWIRKHALDYLPPNLADYADTHSDSFTTGRKLPPMPGAYGAGLRFASTRNHSQTELTYTARQ